MILYRIFLITLLQLSFEFQTVLILLLKVLLFILIVKVSDITKLFFQQLILI